MDLRLAMGDHKKINDGDKIYVEVCQKRCSISTKDEITANVKLLLCSRSNGDFTFEEDSFLSNNVEDFNIWDSRGELVPPERIASLLSGDQISFHIYTLHASSDELEMLDCDNEEMQAAHHWQLPNRCYHNLWDTLIYDTDIKENLLNYTATMLLFSDHGINQDLISWNRVILLHGPPGTGKTSLCKALAQKLSVRLSHRYQSTSLLEINSHSLFSKWFSESGKLVQKMFEKVEELLEDQTHLVCLLIDEVESLTAARSSVNSGTEPSDAIRVVNAVLTHLDRLKHYSNLLILTTSNVTGKIDLAFVDRTDIKFYVGNPSPFAIYSILKSCIDELVRVNIIHKASVRLENASDLNLTSGLGNASQCLWDIANKCVGLSGRTLRKLPFLAFAKFLHGTKQTLMISSFLDALSRSVDVQFKERKNLSNQTDLSATC